MRELGAEPVSIYPRAFSLFYVRGSMQYSLNRPLYICEYCADVSESLHVLLILKCGLCVIISTEKLSFRIRMCNYLRAIC